MNKQKNLVIIPARGNSKGIKNKNLIHFAGKPLLYWTITQAINAKNIDKVIVTSDSSNILNYSKRLGADIVLRPKSLATDTSKSEDALIHVLKNINKSFQNIIFLQATSPLRLKNDITNALKYFETKKYDSLFSCSTSSDWFDVWKTNKRHIIPLTINYKNKPPRQKVKDKYYLQNGSIYIFKKNKFLKNKNRLFGKIGVYIMKEWQSFQIDEKDQIYVMEILHKKIVLNEKIK